MKKFMVLYRAPASAREQMAKATPEQAKAGMDAWMAWSQRCGDALADMGSPLASSGKSAGDPVAGYSVLRAESLDGANKLLEGHPHLMMPGASIEVLEFLPIPGM